MERFSTAAVTARVNGILDAGSFEPLPAGDPATTLTAGRGCVEGEPVWVAATDPSRARGALGMAEGQTLCALFRQARSEPRPLLLLIDSAGANVDEGVGALGAFRWLFREALLTRLAGLPMLALLGKSCFGGASMLATLCGQRLYSTETLLGVSGPGVIQALGGTSELNAGDRSEVRALLGGPARALLGPTESLALDDLSAFRAHTVRWLRESGVVDAAYELKAEHVALGRRLSEGEAVSASPPAQRELSSRRLRRLVHPGTPLVWRGHACMALPQAGSNEPASFGLLGGGAVGAEACWQVADALLDLHRSNPTSPVVLLLDASGHACTRRDEALLLSAYLAHLSLAAGWLAQQGHELSAWLPGAAAGAVYVAFAAPARCVLALRSSRIRILPEVAIRQILGAGITERVDTDALLDARVIDGLLDVRFEAYAEESVA